MQLRTTRDFINTNRSAFKQGATISEDTILEEFNLTKPDFTGMNYDQTLHAAQKIQMQKVAAQNKINRVLAQRGLYMAQHERTSYVIKTAKGVEAKIKAFGQAANRKIARQTELDLGYKAHNAKWSRVKNTELPEA